MRVVYAKLIGNNTGMNKNPRQRTAQRTPEPMAKRTSRRTPQRTPRRTPQRTPKPTTSNRSIHRAVRWFVAGNHDVGNALFLAKRAVAEIESRFEHAAEQGRLSEEDAARLMSCLRSISASIQAAQNRSQDAIDVVRAWSGVNGPRRSGSVTDLALIIRDVCERIGAAFPHRKLEVATPHEIRGVWDRDSAERIIENLVLNAFRAVASSVRVCATATDSTAQLTVEDDGRGIPDHVARALPTMFKRSPHGSGIGLASVSALTAHLGGTIDLVTDPDSGTTFTVSLPCVRQNVRNARARTAQVRLPGS